jgi:dATP pyrophosphohydrolase
MPRAPYNVLVIPFRLEPNGVVFYGVMKRSDSGRWQWIAGGGEGDESPIEAAVRESFEETGLDGPLFRLTSEARLPVHAFTHRVHWSPDLYVIPEHHFAIEATHDVVLSPEHTEIRWLPFEEAHALLHWQSNQTALWELNERIRRNDLTPSVPLSVDREGEGGEVDSMRDRAQA